MISLRNAPEPPAADPFASVGRDEGMPIHVVHQVLSYLSASDLGSVSSACKSWKQLASPDAHPKLLNALELTVLFPKLSIIDKPVWQDFADLEKFELSFADLAPLDKRSLIPHLKDFSSFPVESDAGFTLLTIPRGFSLNKLQEIRRTHHPDFINKIGAHVTNLSYRVLISNSPHSEGHLQSFRDQIKILEELGCHPPSVEEVAAQIALTGMKNQSELRRLHFSSRCSTEFYGQGILVKSSPEAPLTFEIEMNRFADEDQEVQHDVLAVRVIS